MPRSEYTNALIRACLLTATDQSLKMVVNDDGDDHNCNSVEEAFEIVDSVDLSYIKLFDPFKNECVVWFQIIADNDGDEQLSDYLDNELAREVIKLSYTMYDPEKDEPDNDTDMAPATDNDWSGLDALIFNFKQQILDYERRHNVFLEITRYESMKDRGIVVEIKKRYG